MSDLVFFCFQEMKGHFRKSFLPYNPNLQVFLIQNGCKSFSSNFNLSTVILRKKSKNNVRSLHLQKKCTHLGLSINGGYIPKHYGNKGAIYTIVNINSQNYLIINTHAPFASEKGMIGGSYTSFWDSFIQTKIEQYNMEGKTFIVGDLNSLSLINPDLNIQLTPHVKNARTQHFKIQTTQNVYDYKFESTHQ